LKTIDDLYDPYLLKDMDIVVDRIKKAHKNNERIMIF
jgi:single-stranded DNA-specific DHH superfamily exonuclease